MRRVVFIRNNFVSLSIRQVVFKRVFIVPYQAAMPPKSGGDGKKQVNLGSLFGAQKRRGCEEGEAQGPKLSFVETPTKRSVGRPKKEEAQWQTGMPEHQLETRTRHTPEQKAEHLVECSELRAEFEATKVEYLQLLQASVNQPLGKTANPTEEFERHTQLGLKKSQCFRLHAELVRLRCHSDQDLQGLGGKKTKVELSQMLASPSSSQTASSPASSSKAPYIQAAEKEDPETGSGRGEPDGGDSDGGDSDGGLTVAEDSLPGLYQRTNAEIGRALGHLGAGCGSQGGRPRKRPMDLRSIANPLGIFKANRKMPGAEPEREDEQVVAAKAKWLSWFDSVVKETFGGDPESPELWQFLKRQGHGSDAKFRGYVADRDQVQNRMRELSIGKQWTPGQMGPHGRHGPNHQRLLQMR